MSEFDEFFTGNSGAWLDSLPRFQRGPVDELLAAGRSFEDVAEAWLGAGVAHDTLGLGAGQTVKVFYDKVLDEIHDLICTNKGYVEERKTVLADFKKGQTFATASVAEAIAPHVGAAAAVLSVAVVCAFSTISKIGKNAWCKMQTERRTDAAGTDQTP